MSDSHRTLAFITVWTDDSDAAFWLILFLLLATLFLFLFPVSLLFRIDLRNIDARLLFILSALLFLAPAYLFDNPWFEHGLTISLIIKNGKSGLKITKPQSTD
jgi:hypothetical protein